MHRRRAGLLAGGLVGLATAGSGHAHHSFAMFDRLHTVMLRGTVRQFQWTNPHAWIEVWAEPAHGHPAEK